MSLGRIVRHLDAINDLLSDLKEKSRERAEVRYILRDLEVLDDRLEILFGRSIGIANEIRDQIGELKKRFLRYLEDEGISAKITEEDGDLLIFYVDTWREKLRVIKDDELLLISREKGDIIELPPGQLQYISLRTAKRVKLKFKIGAWTSRVYSPPLILGRSKGKLAIKNVAQIERIRMDELLWKAEREPSFFTVLEFTPFPVSKVVSRAHVLFFEAYSAVYAADLSLNGFSLKVNGKTYSMPGNRSGEIAIIKTGGEVLLPGFEFPIIVEIL